VVCLRISFLQFSIARNFYHYYTTIMFYLLTASSRCCFHDFILQVALIVFKSKLICQDFHQALNCDVLNTIRSTVGIFALKLCF